MRHSHELRNYAISIQTDSQKCTASIQEDNKRLQHVKHTHSPIRTWSLPSFHTVYNTPREILAIVLITLCLPRTWTQRNLTPTVSFYVHRGLMQLCHAVGHVDCTPKKSAFGSAPSLQYDVLRQIVLVLEKKTDEALPPKLLTRPQSLHSFTRLRCNTATTAPPTPITHLPTPPFLFVLFSFSLIPPSPCIHSSLLLRSLN